MPGVALAMRHKLIYRIRAVA